MNKTGTGYERFDGCYGTVISRCLKGAYLELDDGEQAFAYKFGNLFPSTKVLCTVLKSRRRRIEGCWFPSIPSFNSRRSEHEAGSAERGKQNAGTLPTQKRELS